MAKYADWTLGQIEALINTIGGDAVARALLRGERKFSIEKIKPAPSPPLLTFAGTITVRPAAKFVAREFFKVNTKKNASVKIPYVGDNFTEWFFGKTEELPSASEAVLNAGPYRTSGVQAGVVETTLLYHTLNRRSVDGPIIAELGGETKVESTLAQIATCMTKQANGEQGALLTNGYANIFYVRSVNGVLSAVRVDWLGDGWVVNAYSVEDPREWRAGDQLFSRDS